jgi:hypothetical protein
MNGREETIAAVLAFPNLTQPPGPSRTLTGPCLLLLYNSRNGRIP